MRWGTLYPPSILRQRDRNRPEEKKSVSARSAAEEVGPASAGPISSYASDLVDRIDPVPRSIVQGPVVRNPKAGVR
ncbi:hypothetical protein AKJ08_0052 [Vulgatibacter incomptus]|uniref:Uncharacterized protein n=1 Tax=Vulgatibacter incomptus TaxID=1391653 RepID=A0A0K1P818_9BACT|nr:hypothetical protein AKJ08_0052 [Vulgatibacter incomptus]